MHSHGTHNALDDPRNQDVLISINGELVPRAQAKISVFDSGFLVGDGVWEAMRVHAGHLVFAKEHMDRLEEGAKAIGLEIGLSRKALLERVQAVLQANDMVDGVHVRLMVTRGDKKTPSQDPRLALWGPNIVIIAEHKTVAPETYERGIMLFTSTIRRGSPDTLDPRLNCHSKLHEVLALNQAVARGMLGECDRSVLFIKNMAQHWRGGDPELLLRFVNVQLFRHPALVARSFDKVVATPCADDLGYPMQLEIAREMEARGLPVIGLDSTRVRNDPERELTRLCERLDLPFDASMLSWEAGARPEDGVWAPYWYANVHASTGFSPDRSELPAVEDLAPHLHDVVHTCLPMYERLLAYCAV